MDRQREKENQLRRSWSVEFVGSSGLSLRYGLSEAVEKVPMGRASAPPTSLRDKFVAGAVLRRSGEYRDACFFPKYPGL